MSAVVILWSVWCGWSLLRATWSLLALRRFRRRAEPMPAERERALRLWPVQRDSGRAATLRVSRDVATAGVFGFHPPIIALSPTTLAALSNADLDRVVAHEHAHVQRRDDIGRVLLVAIQAVFGLHPAVWWIGRAIDLEREIACDDWVLALTGDGPRYARCLTTLASVSPAPGWSLAPGVSLATRRLTMRVTRLLDQGQRGGTRISPAAVVVWSPALLSMAVSLAAVKLVVVQEAEALAASATSAIEQGVTSMAAPLPTPATLAAPARCPRAQVLEQAASGRCRCTAARPSRPDDRCAAADFGVSRVGACHGGIVTRAHEPAHRRVGRAAWDDGFRGGGRASAFSRCARDCRGQETRRTNALVARRRCRCRHRYRVAHRGRQDGRVLFPLWKVRRVVVPTDASEPEAEEVGPFGYSSATSSVVSSKS